MSCRFRVGKRDLNALAAGLERVMLARADDLQEFAGLCEELSAVAARLKDSQEREFALRGRIGPEGRRLGPPMLELAAELLLARVSALRPHIPAVSEESAERAVCALMEEAGVYPELDEDELDADLDSLDDGDAEAVDDLL